MNDHEPQTIFLQIREPDEQGFVEAEVNTDGLPETGVECVSPHIMGIAHWVSSELGLRIFDRLVPSGRWKPGDDLTPGLYILEPKGGNETP